MEQIIAAIPEQIIEAGIQETSLLYHSPDLEVRLLHKEKHSYSVLMKAIGRLRESTSRSLGGGTGKAFDSDTYDDIFYQILLWVPSRKEIIGGCRVAYYPDLMERRMFHTPIISSPISEYFIFSKGFIKDYANKTLEIGRVFIIPEDKDAWNQPLYHLFIGIFIEQKNLTIEYFCNKISFFTGFDSEFQWIKNMREYIFFLLESSYPQRNSLIITPKEACPFPRKDNMHGKSFIEKLHGIYESFLDLDDIQKDKILASTIFTEQIISLKSRVRFLKEIALPHLFLAYTTHFQQILFTGVACAKEAFGSQEVCLLVNVALLKDDARKWINEHKTGLS